MPKRNAKLTAKFRNYNVLETKLIYHILFCLSTGKTLHLRELIFVLKSPFGSYDVADAIRKIKTIRYICNRKSHSELR